MNFVKYQGTGNDFIMLDNRDNTFTMESEIPSLCDRRFGIGSDGLILIQSHPDSDFEMVFYNPDGSTSFCGNGSRCAVAFASSLGIIDTSCTFRAIDGLHDATIQNSQVSVKMADCKRPEKVEDGLFIHTGSPHYVLTHDGIMSLDINMLGTQFRHREDLFGAGGTNVNLLEEDKRGSVFVRTFERGVEAETLSCGTGVTAAAICYGLQNKMNQIDVATKGGHLTVSFSENSSTITDIYLSGPADKVFEGSISL